MSGWIDIHSHWCLFGREPAEVVAELEWLEARGCERFALYPLPGLGASPEKVLDMVPGAYRDLTGLTAERTALDDLEAWRAFERLWSGQPHGLELLTFLDVRAWDGRTDLSPWWGDGHAGLKGILIEEEDAGKMLMPPLRRVPGLDRAAYFEAQRAVFDAAARLGVPLVYHVDLTLHRAFVEECLQAHPDLPVDIPHFGFSRRAMAEILARFPAVRTDISSLGPHMDKNPDSYRGFILGHPDRVLLGSDVIACHDVRPAYEYVRRVQELDLPETVERSVLRGNALRFLGAGAGGPTP